MKNIILIPSFNLPIPAVKGGAVQNLLEDFIEYNEVNKEYNLKVFSIRNNDAKKQAKKYKYSNIIYVPFSNILHGIIVKDIKKISGLCYKVTQKYYSFYIKKYITKNIKECDCIIYENTPFLYYDHCKILEGTPTLIYLYNDYINKKNSTNELIVKKAHHICTVSGYGRDFLNTLYPNKKTTVVYNGIDIGKFDISYDNTTKSEKYKKIGKEKIILFVGRLVPDKGIKELMQAINKVDPKYKCKLLIVGNKLYSGNVVDAFNEQLLKIAEENPSRFEFLGHIDHDDLYKYYQISDIGVLPSTYEEPFSMSALEYMAAGMGVIVTAVGGFPEMIGDSGILIPNDEKIVERLKEKIELLLGNEQLLDEYGKRAKVQIESYSIKNHCDNKSAVIKKVISKGDL